MGFRCVFWYCRRTAKSRIRRERVLVSPVAAPVSRFLIHVAQVSAPTPQLLYKFLWLWLPLPKFLRSDSDSGFNIFSSRPSCFDKICPPPSGFASDPCSKQRKVLIQFMKFNATLYYVSRVQILCFQKHLYHLIMINTFKFSFKKKKKIRDSEREVLVSLRLQLWKSRPRGSLLLFTLWLRSGSLVKSTMCDESS